MFRAGLFIACTSLALAGCASTPSAPYRTPQVTIANGNAEQAKLTIVRRCIEGGGSVIENTAHSLVCSKPMPNDFKSTMFRALATPNYSTNPNLKARYTFVQAPAQLFISVDTLMDYQTAFGQTNVMPIQNAEAGRLAQQMLDSIKAEMEGRPASTPSSMPTTPAPTQPASDCKACAKIGG